MSHSEKPDGNRAYGRLCYSHHMLNRLLETEITYGNAIAIKKDNTSS